MDILNALNIQSHERIMISLAGGGGKTSIMYRLAREMKLLGMKVLVTTTTAIYYPDKSLYDYIFLWDSIELHSLEKSDPGQGLVAVIGSGIIEELKLKGIPGEWVDKLYESRIFDAILVEADGSKGKPIKAPDSHEPVIPELTSVFIGVIGFDCYGKKMDQEWVHRPQLLCNLTGKTECDLIDGSVILKLALSPKGIFKNCPEGVDKVLFINKVKGMEDLVIAEKIGNSVLKSSTDIDRVLIGSIQETDPIITMLERKNT